MRVDLGDLEETELPTSTFHRFADTSVWKERVEPILDLYALRYRLALDVFGGGDYFKGIPKEFHDELLGEGYGNELGATVSIDNLISPDELESRFRAIKEATTGSKYIWNGSKYVELPSG